MAIQAARQKKTVNEVTMLGTQFIRWGLGLFIFGLIIGYGPLAHYLHGALEQVGPSFLQNVTLWFGCPWTLSVYTVQVGSLGMVVIGFVYLHLPTDDLEAEQRDLAAFWFCVAGLIAVFLTGYVGYFVVNAIWPSFYYVPIKAGKNVWLIAQGLSILLYLIGVVLAYLSICHVTQFGLERSPRG
jgi:hypothetical protein